MIANAGKPRGFVKPCIKKIHRWLGLTSGLLVVLLGITGCILAFEQEIRDLTEPYRFVQQENRPKLPPSVLKMLAEKELDGKKANAIEYPGNGRSVVVSYYDAENYKIVFLHPWSGAILKVKDMNGDFFRIVLRGHFYCWLPPAIGQPIVASATLIFVVLMITGLILWWPKNKKARKQRFSIKWDARWRRKNFDLHTVLGFYMTWVTIFIALTGLVMGFQWFARSVYWISSGGKTLSEHVHPLSDTSSVNADKEKRALIFQGAAGAIITDECWKKHVQGLSDHESISVDFANEPTDLVEVVVNHRPGTYYKTDSYHYDQCTGKEIPVEGPYSGTYKAAPIADKIARMNYDTHVGAILGPAGKILAFFGSLIAASLPITGFLIWWGRRRKAKPAPGIIF